MASPQHLSSNGDTPARRWGVRLRLCLAAAFICITAALWAFVRLMGAAAFPAYRNASKTLMGVLSTIASVAPFALWDFAVPILIVLAICALVRSIRAGRGLISWLSWVLVTCSAIGFLLVGGWALNHYAPPLAEELDLQVGEYDVDELADACGRYLADAARLADSVPRDESGQLADQDFFELARLSGAAYANLQDEYEVFSGSTAPVKALVAAGEPLLWSGHVGVFVAATGEASVPFNCARAEMAFTMCHEAAHRLGIASEQEANFSAYLACTSSDDVRLRYSGAYSAFSWCVSALLRADPERAQQVVDEVAQEGLAEGVVLVLADRAATREHYAAYEGPAEDVGTAVNDAYLKTFGQAEGVRSYGLVVDYLIAWNAR